MTDKTDLLDFIERIERGLFRTNQDTGANTNALMVWNRVREFAGLPRLTRDDLRQRHIDSSPGQTMEKILAYEDFYDDYSVLRDYPNMKRRYDALMAQGGMDGLFDRHRKRKGEQ